MKLGKMFLILVAVGIVGACASATPGPSSHTRLPKPDAVIIDTGFVRGLNRRPVAARSRESWLGADKVKHFFISAFVESMGFGALQAAGAERRPAFAGALVLTATAGIGKEIHDRRRKQPFSVPDLAWDALGAGAAFFVLTLTQK